MLNMQIKEQFCEPLTIYAILMTISSGNIPQGRIVLITHVDGQKKKKIK